jgi:hypothetical protein
VFLSCTSYRSGLGFAYNTAQSFYSTLTTCTTFSTPPFHTIILVPATNEAVGGFSLATEEEQVWLLASGMVAPHIRTRAQAQAQAQTQGQGQGQGQGQNKSA